MAERRGDVMIAPVDWIAYVNQELRISPKIRKKIFIERFGKVEAITDFYRAAVNPIGGHLGKNVDSYA